MLIHRSAAAAVERQPRWASGRRVVSISPLHQHHDRGRESCALVGQGVFGPAGPLRIWNALEQSLGREELQPIAEDVGREAKARLKLLEGLEPEHGITQNQERPAFADDLERSRDGAHLLGVGPVEHSSSRIAHLLDTS